MLSRAARKKLGEETVAILRAKAYKTPTGKTVSLDDALARCLSNTRVIAPDDSLPLPQPGAQTTTTILEVTDESTLEACQRLTQHYYNESTADGPHVVALNFASAHNPGGGFLTGSQAQEESIARNSTLYASQTAHRGMYECNARLKRGDATAPHTIYSDAMLYSPHVTVFRDEHSGHLLENPYNITVISAPAPNAGATYNTFGRAKGVPTADLQVLVNDALRRRLERVLALSAMEGAEVLVLGAYGCGVFQNDVASVIAIYRSLLLGNGPFANTFRHVTFAIYGKPSASYSAFKSAFP